MSRQQVGEPPVDDRQPNVGEATEPVDFHNILNPPKESNHHRVLAFLPNWVKNEFVGMMAEYVGTVMFLIFAFGGTNVANVPVSNENTSSINSSGGSNPALLLYISLCFGFSLTVNAWIFYRISGGLFNPAVSFALALIGSITWLRCALLTIAQILGGITAAAIVDVLTPGSLNVSVSLGGGTSRTQGLFLEAFLSAELIFTIIMLAAEKHRATFLAPVGIGLALFIAELWGVYYTGGSLNPARAFGPAVVIRSFHDYHWIYWLGPYLGGLAAAGYYLFIKYMRFESVNPGQDEDGELGPDEALEKVLDERGLGRRPTHATSTSHHNDFSEHPGRATDSTRDSYGLHQRSRNNEQHLTEKEARNTGHMSSTAPALRGEHMV